MPVGCLSRLLRAVAFAVACVVVSALGHAWMSGAPVPRWAVAAGAAGVLPLAFVLARRRCGYARIAVSMLVCEFGLHELFAVAQRSARASLMSGVVMPARHGVGASLAPHGDGRMPVPLGGGARSGSMPRMPSGVMALTMGHGPWGMATFHVVASLLCAWWLWRGEAAAFALLWSIAMFLSAPFFLLVVRSLPISAPRSVPLESSAADQPDGLRGLLAHAVVRRGPPAMI